MTDPERERAAANRRGAVGRQIEDAVQDLESAFAELKQVIAEERRRREGEGAT